MLAPNEWQTALQRFRDGYGCEPDFLEDEDRTAFLQLLRAEVAITVRAELASFFTEATARLREEGT
jgi:hypothetical protein